MVSPLCPWSHTLGLNNYRSKILGKKTTPVLSMCRHFSLSLFPEQYSVATIHIVYDKEIQKCLLFAGGHAQILCKHNIISYRGLEHPHILVFVGVLEPIHLNTKWLTVFYSFDVIGMAVFFNFLFRASIGIYSNPTGLLVLVLYPVILVNSFISCNSFFFFFWGIFRVFYT
jgi:hypothetical protein